MNESRNSPVPAGEVRPAGRSLGTATGQNLQPTTLGWTSLNTTAGTLHIHTRKEATLSSAKSLRKRHYQTKQRPLAKVANMAPSFDQLDPETEYDDGEDDLDFSGLC